MTLLPRSRALASRIALLASLGCVDAAMAQTENGFDFGGTQRTRYETLDPQFRAGFSNSDQAAALQTTLVFNWRRDSWLVGGEVMDSRNYGVDSGSFVNGTTTNALEPIQAYVAWRHTASTFRIGRVTQDLGKRRLVARNRYRNTVNNFTGVDWSWTGAEGRAARAFYWVPMRTLPSDLDSLLDNEFELDKGVRGGSITGLFYEFPTFANQHRLETYVFDAESESRNDLTQAYDHITLGARTYRTPQASQWNYEVEAVLQDGESGGTVAGVARSDLDHRASFLHLEIGYQFDAPGSPNLMFQYDRATGDKDPTDLKIDRFNTLFGARRFDFGPTGIYGIAARSNIDSPGVRLTFRPGPKWQAMLAYRALRLETPRDGWIGSGWRDTTGAAGDSIGTHLEGSFTWTAIPDRLSFETGFAHLWAGRFAEQTAGAAFRGDPQYFYAALTTTF
ncbi:MAG TPA: alginate export family protein [Gammaproteobacteria bacterium]